jgi:hypothetical protein
MQYTLMQYGSFIRAASRTKEAGCFAQERRNLHVQILNQVFRSVSTGSARQYTNCTAHVVVVSYMLSVPPVLRPAAGLTAQHLSRGSSARLMSTMSLTALLWLRFPSP